MLHWVKLVLAPYVATAPKGIVPILFLDMFKVHMMQSVVQAIQALVVQVEFIPAGCTGLIQPIDVEYNKSLKALCMYMHRSISLILRIHWGIINTGINT